MSAWTGVGGIWTWSPYLPGNEEPGEPPIGVPAFRGEDSVRPGGYTYKTWIVLSPSREALQKIIDWKSNMDDPNNPFLQWYRDRGGTK